MKSSTIALIPLLLGATSAHADLSISKKPTHDVDCTGGVCTATAKSANLNTSDLTRMLAAGDATVKTGGGALDIAVRDGFSWTSTSRLTLDANRSVEIHKPVTVAGQGAATIAYNDGGSNGDLEFLDKGRIDFWDVNSSLTIDGTSYMLVNDIASLASAIAANPSGAYALAADYDAQNDGIYLHSPVRTIFHGFFEGLGHEVRNVTISSSDDLVGFFADIGTGTIRDFKMDSENLTSDGGSDIGLLSAGGGSLVEHVTVNGAISAEGTRPIVGGLVGNSLDGIFLDCGANVEIASEHAFYAGGGLVGLSTGKIIRSHANGDVSSGFDTKGVAGGLAGYAALIDQSYATGTVTVIASPKHGTFAGGLAGIASTVMNSYASGGVVGGDADNLGGLVGAGVTGGPTLMSVYATGAVSAANQTGGLVGHTSGHNFNSAYWDVDTTGQSKACGNRNCGKAQGLTDAQLKSGLPDGFDPKIWGQSPDINNGYPYLLANPPE